MTLEEILTALDAQMELDTIRGNIDLAELRGEITPQEADEARRALLTPLGREFAE